MKVIITEKPSVAREIARVFGATKKKEGYIEGENFCFTWAFGHLLQLASPQEYGYYGWDRRNLPMIPGRFKLSVRQVRDGSSYKDDPGVVKQLGIIKKLFDEATEIIVATDAGREGELIFRYIYYYLKCRKPFKRLWISSQTDEAIKKGFKSLKDGVEYDTLFNSAHCRAQSDWLVGMNATQALTIASGKKSVLSLGRVQTPTLAMICARFLENKSFVPEPFFQIRILVDKEGNQFKALSTKKFKTENEAQKALEEVEDVERGFPAGAEILSAEGKPKKEPPPLLHDLSSMQQEANKKFGFTADQTLDILQKLYEGKLVSYPRTGSRFIGDDVFATVPGLIKIFQDHPRFGKTALGLVGAKLNRRSVNAKKVTDHHAILPTGEIPRHLSQEQWSIYELVAGRMLEAFSTDCLKDVTKISIRSGILFAASGTVIKQPGWRAVFEDQEEEKADEENATLPKLEKGEFLPIPQKELLQKSTKPRPLFTEATLLKAMETAGKDIDDEVLRQAMKDTGLGTPATRAATIETLITRKYIIREKKNLVPTETGLGVYQVVKDQKIAHPELTGAWEKRLEEIRGGASVQDFQNEIRQYTWTITHELLEAGKIMRPTAVPTVPVLPEAADAGSAATES